ncbi:response regulator [Opitutus sp. ER46]|uniref:response regulator n=1 Tax=Opitutus sp. ER46 TaxID=2161864 RepID=UPI001304F261|nr:response regulator [Opitutus sp. ER46]
MQTLPSDASLVAPLVSRAVFPSTAFPTGNAAAPGSFRPVVDAPSGVDRSLPPILVADDDPDDRFFIRRLIGRTGTAHPLLTFDDGTEVVNYLGAIVAAGPEVRARAPRLLFLDLRMGGLGGFGFLEWARQHRTTLPMTIVVLSNSIEPADVARAHELGAHRYLVKYPSVQTFGTIIRSVYPQTITA